MDIYDIDRLITYDKIMDVRTSEEFEFITYNKVSNKVMASMIPGGQVYWIEPQYLMRLVENEL